MQYIIIIIIVIIIINFIQKKTYLWETVIKDLWKRIYRQAYLVAREFKSEDKENDFGQTYVLEKYGKSILLKGNIINSILDYINYINKEKDENFEEETFGYGRFDFNFIINTAKNNPEFFNKFK
jgi:hypothetical protein